MTSFIHTSTLTAAAKIQPIEFQNQQAVAIRISLSRQLIGDHILSLDPCPYPSLICYWFLYESTKSNEHNQIPIWFGEK